ncbi:hypothetical protein RB595_005814 [Gaeumannomyces hyphopodioides]
MSGVKDVFKSGWHPDKGTTLKQQVSGVFTRGGDSSQRSTSHNVTPLSQLKDPSSFAPPPKRSIAPPPPPPSSRPTAPPAQSQPPPIPARSGSGYSGGAAGGPGAPISTPPLPAGSPGPPRLPPRLPPRPASGASSPGASPSALSAPPPPIPPSQSPSVLNQGAIGRLGAAGISVPGLGIGSGSKTSSPQDSPASSSPSSLGGLQARFAKLGTSSSPSAASPTQPRPPPSEGTTFAQKQAALKTASDFHKDPRSVSLSDARAAASTMNNFRQRHGDQVAAGVKTANGLNQKYAVTDKVAAYSQQHQGAAASPATANSTPAGPQQGEAPPGLGSLASAGALAAGALAKKRPPPPPPPKRKPDIARATTSATVADDEPPPIPHATRPIF